MLNAVWLYAAAEGSGLHSHHQVFLPFLLLWHSNRATTVLRALERFGGPVAPWLFILLCVCFLITADLSHCMGARSDARKEAGAHVGCWSREDAPCSNSPQLRRIKYVVNLHPKQGETLFLSLFAGGFLAVWDLNKATWLLHTPFVSIVRNHVTLW